MMVTSRNSLEVFFRPRNIAVIGATENQASIGRTILWNLVRNPFGGTVLPVNPNRRSVLGVRAYPSIGKFRLRRLSRHRYAAATVPGIIQECVDAGVKGVIIISAGFKETGPQGASLEQEIFATASRGEMRVIGPNCLGVMSPIHGVNATFAGAMAIFAQGGVGSSAKVARCVRPSSIGAERDGRLQRVRVEWNQCSMWGLGDLIQYLGEDPHTRSIVIYMETIGDARSFLSAAREVAMTKPIVVIKPGQTEAASKAAASHTGSLSGSDEVLNAAFRRVGVLRVSRISDLFECRK